MSNWLGISALNPVLLWGTLLVAAPIIIHLLSKRRFRVLEWAAMDFLLEAERRNRRRIRLENLLLLLLRCLAVILVALVVARPLLKPSGLAASAMSTVPFERLVLLDDSPSMTASAGAKPVFAEAIDGLKAFVQDLARDRPHDTFTLLLTSRPDRPVINGAYLTAEKIGEITQTLTDLKPSDLPAQLDKALLAVEDGLTGKSGPVSRMLYVITDLRRRDWAPAATPGGAAVPAVPGGAATQDGTVPAILRRVAAKTSGAFIVDVAGDNGAHANLSVTDVTPLDKALVAGVESRFEVSVVNQSDRDVDETEVSFYAGDAVPLRAKAVNLKPGEKASVPFTVTFRDAGSVPVRVEIGADALPADNTRFFAARVREGVSVLVVDGDPSTEYGRSESFYLARALSPPGEARSGNSLEVITENQFEGLPLDKYQVVFLTNLYQLSDDRVKALEAWVQAGGGLVVFLGDQVNAEAYNERVYKDGKGLLPMKLAEIKGDETQKQWVHFATEAATHPLLKVFEGASNPFIKGVKVYRWWNGAVHKAEVAAGRAAVLASFTDPDASPALVERTFGDGKVLLATTAADNDWTNWPGDPSYVVTLLETVRHMARRTTGEGALGVGTPIRYELDAARYEVEAKLTAPANAVSSGPAPTGGAPDAAAPGSGAATPGGAAAKAVPDADATTLTATPSPDGKKMLLQFDDTTRAGFYRLALRRHDGQSDPVLFAANLDPTEGDLHRADGALLKRQLGDAKVEIVRGRASLAQGGLGAGAEFWRALVLALAIVLGLEQVLAWTFGKRR